MFFKIFVFHMFSAPRGHAAISPFPSSSFGRPIAGGRPCGAAQPAVRPA
jgi:hypothetical protein